MQRAGRLDEAERLYRAVLGTRPLDFDALRGLGLALLRRGRNAEALQTLSRATSVSPKHAGAWCELGVAHTYLGRLDEALGCYDRALSLEPRHAEAHANKGCALAMLKRPTEALECFDKALAVNSRLANIHSNRGGVLRELGRSSEALESLDRALTLAPGNADALNNRGNALVELGRHQEALASYEAALAANPTNANIYLNRGNALVKLKRADEALASFDRAAVLGLHNAELLTGRGAALQALNRQGEALNSLVKALALAPHSAPIYNSLATMLMELERPLEALPLYDQAIALNPQYVEALANRAGALSALKRPAEALASCDTALAIAPQYVDALINRGASLTNLGRESEALASYDAAIANAPDSALAHENKGVALLQQGRLAEAASAFEASIALEASRARAYYHLSLVRRFQPGDRHVEALAAQVNEGKQTTPQNQVYAHFALGKAFADAGDHQRSFHHLAIGNATKRQLNGYDEAAFLGQLDRSRLAYTEELMQRFVGVGANSSAPLFVLGMPRSGTTLVEQILDSHPDVFGAGEINDLELAARECGGATTGTLSAPDSVWRMRPEDFRALGERYMARLQGQASQATRIVNKTPDNFRYVGLIALALPQARIIHVRREPLDTCISCFTNLFTENIPYAYDLAELGRYYRGYEALMAHWRHVLPPGVMLDVQYEDVVADLEGVARRIVAHCGLEWDPHCVDFHKNERSVRTASVAQVRQPINARSVGRWRAYEAHLGPLVDALGPART